VRKELVAPAFGASYLGRTGGKGERPGPALSAHDEPDGGRKAEGKKNAQAGSRRYSGTP